LIILNCEAILMGVTALSQVNMQSNTAANDDPKHLLDQVNLPEDIRDFTIPQLQQLAYELREASIAALAKTGGKLGAALGVIELTVALHHVFKTPHDQLVWDIGHQGLPHKILTGRKHQVHTMGQPGGISGFLKRSESEYDTFGAGHCSTSISAALGMAVARDMNGDDFNVVAVIGDGALTSGMAYEAMNSAGHLRSRLIVILNDNEMSIAPNLGAMHRYLNRLTSSKPYLQFRHMAKNMLHHMPEPIEHFTKKAKQYAKDFITGGNFFEEMGFHYIGPLNGHDITELVPVLRNLKEDSNIESPILIHIKTEKGHGFNSPDACTESYHAVSKFDPSTRIQIKASSSKPTYTKVFGEALTKLAGLDDKIIGITAAMPSGTGMNILAKSYPDRMFDVCIAEQHAVTFGAGLATQGIIPFVAIYSTFLQRAYDQVVHDVAIQCLPVRFILDRAGVVGGDGPTHAGSYDLTYLCTLPNFIVMAPADEAELVHMVTTSYHINDKPSAIRFPRGEGLGVDLPATPGPLPIGKGRYIKKGKSVAIISLGTRLQQVMLADKILQTKGFDITIFDARFAKPIDEEAIREIALSHELIITLEEGAIGGFGSHVGQFLTSQGLLDNGLKFRSLFMPDRFIEHNTPEAMYEEAGLNASSIVNTVCNLAFTKSKRAANA
jgi:1-deoxy-D-xylulose-5-phosphate synthase